MILFSANTRNVKSFRKSLSDSLDHYHLGSSTRKHLETWSRTRAFDMWWSDIWLPGSVCASFVLWSVYTCWVSRLIHQNWFDIEIIQSKFCNVSNTINFFCTDCSKISKSWSITISYIRIKEYKEEAQCAQKGGRMLFFVICGFIENFFLNFYFILQIYHVKSFKMMHVTSMYFDFSLRYS